MLLGHETVGRVHEIGEVAAKEMEVRGKPLKEGDRVVWFPGMYCGKCFYCRMAPQNLNLCRGISYYGWTNASRPENKPWIFGGYGQYVYIRPGTWVYKVKEGVSTEAVAMLDTMTSIKGVEMAMTPYPNIREGFGFMDTAVVQGAGSVGLCAVAKLK
ncbi:MAG: alcohol dehydrogenase catalytic domain-containing protein, partial [Candidatus Bathyarchaeia archaeon]